MAILTGGIGWKGFMKVSSSEVGSGKVLPFNTEDLVERVEAINNDGIHGGGVSELNGIFGSRHNIAIGVATYTGSINGDVFGGTGQYADAFRILLDHAMGRSSADHTHRLMGFSEAYPIIVSPTGETTYQYPSQTVINRKTGATDTLTTPVKAVIGNMTINGNSGGNVNYTAAIQATSRREVTGVKPTTADFSFEAVSNLDDSNPIPFWQAAFNVTGSGEDFGGGSYTLRDYITDFSLTINNNTQPVYTFNGNNVATDMVQGLMEITGSFSYYSPTGIFTANLNNGCTLDLTLGGITLHSPYMFLPTAPVPSGGLNSIITRNVEFSCLATAAGASLYIL